MPEHRIPTRHRSGPAFRLLTLALGTCMAVAACPSPIRGDDPPGAGGAGGRPMPLPTGAGECERTAARPEDCRIARIVQNIESYWSGYFERRGGRAYRPARAVLFEQRVRTPCGVATASVGPFYCPSNERVYLYRTFFDTLERDFAAAGGALAQAYVIAHEYGHHAQNLLGEMGRSREGSRSEELQADCYGGVWAKHAVDTRFFPRPFTEADIRQSFESAEQVGRKTIDLDPGRRSDSEWTTNPERGSFDERRQWFTTGYESGDPARCAVPGGRA
ncbi:hypothetical protein DP939_33995 [Spongiactinospora rosea]|uniref:Metalloprotease n=1 Tax=Spongiactinospora rosea TaxID=2248750 RepID=A0A366LPX8_9ACTN|nr:neutral zinc metallopeptidase [Spongiactinospora rosea]RBQ15700.1 hypothetical protein DP939_33995 [Spongiactinospora rosea]